MNKTKLNGGDATIEDVAKEWKEGNVQFPLSVDETDKWIIEMLKEWDSNE